MNIFISWSGPRSKAVAEVLRKWLRSVVQSTKPWMSSEDIPQGKLWRNELFPKLATSNFAVVCLTRENLEAPWLLFEAGAIARQLLMPPKEKVDEEQARVYTYLLDVENTGIKPPLGDLQHTKADKPSTRKLFWEINKLQTDPLDDKEFSPLFEFAWQDIEPELERIRGMAAGQTMPPRTKREMIEEILERVRQQSYPLTNEELAAVGLRELRRRAKRAARLYHEKRRAELEKAAESSRQAMMEFVLPPIEELLTDDERARAGPPPKPANG